MFTEYKKAHIKTQNDKSILIDVVSDDSPAVTLQITSPCKNMWRIQQALPDGSFLKNGAVQTLKKIAEINAPTAKRTDEIETQLHPDKMVIARKDSKLEMQVHTTDFNIEFTDSLKNTRLVMTGLKDYKNGELKIQFQITPEECLYGMGERFDCADQRGKNVRIWAEDQWCKTEGNSYIPIPFLMSSEKYGIFLNRYEASEFDLGNSNASLLQMIQHDAPFDLYVCIGESPKKILASFSTLWGKPTVPPEWGFGMLVSRHGRTHEFSTSDGVLEMAKQMEKQDLPWSGVIVEGWETFNVKKHDDLKKLVHKLHTMDKKLMVYEACGRLPKHYWEANGAKSEYFVSNTDGDTAIKEAPHFNPEDAPNRKESSFIDITNPEAVKWWTHDVWKKLLDEIKVDGAKIDFCEEIPEDKNIVFASGRSPKGMHHEYPTLYNIMMCQLYQEHRKHGGCCWSRGGSTGAHLYPFVWCGDQRREYPFLKAILTSILTAGLSGIPFMGHDLGGYLPASNKDNETGVFARGVELATFTATMSTHGTVTRPYDFDKTTIHIFRTYCKIRYAIMPYILKTAKISKQTGLPFVRHLFLDYPHDSKVRQCGDQFMFGEDILAAPILDDKFERDIYLPEGMWKELNTGIEYSGNQKFCNFNVPKERIPLFVKENASDLGKKTAEIISTMLKEAFGKF